MAAHLARAGEGRNEQVAGGLEAHADLEADLGEAIQRPFAFFSASFSWSSFATMWTVATPALMSVALAILMLY